MRLLYYGVLSLTKSFHSAEVCRQNPLISNSKHLSRMMRMTSQSKIPSVAMPMNVANENEYVNTSSIKFFTQIPKSVIPPLLGDNVSSKKSLVGTLGVENTPLQNIPQVVGHRGAPFLELENTRAGFQVAADIGCHAVELDVFLLKCGTLVVFHGGGTDGNPGCLREYCCIEGNILDHTADEARHLKFNPLFEEFKCPSHKITDSSRSHIPTLEDVLLDAKKSGIIVKIELKGHGTEEPVLELVERLDMVAQCHFASFHHNRIARIRELRPHRGSDGFHVYKTGALWGCHVPEDFVSLSLDAGASEVHLKYDTCTASRVNEIHANGMGSMAWFRGPIGMKEDVTHMYHDVGNEDEDMYLAVMKTGVWSVCVNRPDVLLEVLRKHESSVRVIRRVIKFTDPEHLERLMNFTTKVLVDSPHAEFNLQWCLEHLKCYCMYLQKHRHQYIGAFRTMSKILQTKHDKWKTMCGRNRYKIGFIVQQRHLLGCEKNLSSP